MLYFNCTELYFQNTFQALNYLQFCLSGIIFISYPQYFRLTSFIFKQNNKNYNRGQGVFQLMPSPELRQQTRTHPHATYLQ